jgi:hypothetical protein
MAIDYMNWIEIDKILWEAISKWDGAADTRIKMLSRISKKFNWTDKQTEFACANHFNMRIKLQKKETIIVKTKTKSITKKK